MKIRSNIITFLDMHAAFQAARDINGADIHIESWREFKPRGFAHGVEMWAESLHGTRATGHVPARASGPRDGYPRAASWDDWGFVIARLYLIDPDARIGFYDNAADFEAKVRKHPRKGSALPFLTILAEGTRA